MDRQGFAEIETPLLWAPTPEGSREFSVPSRLHHGSFYALPQSPQLAKQLLMVGGFDRYFQIARCLRDEDLRADRQFEFMQLDMECSFASQDDVMAYVSEAVIEAAEAATGERPPPIERVTWAESRDRFGTDKPDLRFGMELVDLTDVFAGTEVKAFSSPAVKAIVVPEGATFARKRLDELTEQAKKAGAAGLAWFRVVADEDGNGNGTALDGPLARHLSEQETATVLGRTEAGPGDLILGVSDEYATACAVLGTLRVAIGAPPVSEGPHRYVWVVDFPMFDGVGADGHPQAAHHPFTMPYPEDLPLLATDPVGGALAGIRPGAERMGAGIGKCPYPPPGDTGAGVRRTGHRARGGRGALRVPARRLPLRGAAARRVRRRGRPAGGDPRRRGEHPRGHCVPQDPVRGRPVDGRSHAAARRRPGRTGHQGRGAAGHRRQPRPRVDRGHPLSLFADAADRRLQRQAPLAARLRPRTLDEVVGQEHLIGPGAPLRRLAESDRVGSSILWGPAGTGKTTLARLLADTTAKHLITLSATAAGVKDVREALAEAQRRLGEQGQGTMLFIDEVHRFSKSQQDVLLPAVEDGLVVLIGATTENPFFEVNPPLLSRASLWRLHPLSPDNLRTLIRRGLDLEGADAEDDAIDAVVAACEGDARAALTTVETAVDLARGSDDARVLLTMDDMARARDGRLFHQGADEHYDQISALIKSVRGSDPDAGLYWMARMIEAGEDPRFLARRMVILASEDIGLADPQALLVAEAAARAVEYVGLPEAALNLAEAVIYLARAPKSNAVVVALGRAQADVRSSVSQEVPAHLRDAHYKGAATLGHGEGYVYPHDDPSGVVVQQYRPDALEGRVYYEPTAATRTVRVRLRTGRLIREPRLGGGGCRPRGRCARSGRAGARRGRRGRRSRRNCAPRAGPPVAGRAARACGLHSLRRPTLRPGARPRRRAGRAGPGRPGPGGGGRVDARITRIPPVPHRRGLCGPVRAGPGRGGAGVLGAARPGADGRDARAGQHVVAGQRHGLGGLGRAGHAAGVGAGTGGVGAGHRQHRIAAGARLADRGGDRGGRPRRPLPGARHAPAGPGGDHRIAGVQRCAHAHTHAGGTHGARTERPGATPVRPRPAPAPRVRRSGARTPRRNWPASSASTSSSGRVARESGSPSPSSSSSSTR